jgi:GT2 family glycosyltransferase
MNINEARLTIAVLEKLASLPTQEFTVQLILVDNGSQSDQLQQLTEWFLANKDRFHEVLLIDAFQNLGANEGRNIIIKLALYDRILFLDNDVILPEDFHWLNVLWERMDEDPQLGIVGPMIVFAEYPNIVESTGVGLTSNGRVGYLNRADFAKTIIPTQMEVVASPSTCWLMRKDAQQAVGFFSDDFYPVQYEDIDFCVRIGLAGWKTVCDCSIKIQHIGNVTTRNIRNHSFARLTVRQGMRFKEKWADILPQIATIHEKDIYWGPIPRNVD